MWLNNKKNKNKKIGDALHSGNVPKPQGKWLYYIDRCPLWLAFVILFTVIFMEILVFACIYMAIASVSFTEGMNYSFFSTLGEMATESTLHSVVINRIISFQSILTSCIISFFMAIILYKLINTKPVLLKVEDHLVFDCTTGTLRLRVANISKFELINVHVDAYFRIHIPEGGRHATTRLHLKTEELSYLAPYMVWNIATKPFLPKDKNSAALDVSKYDSDRVCEFIPDLLNEKYRSDDEKKAKNQDYKNLHIIFTVKSPFFNTDWTYHKSFSARDFVCGKLVSLNSCIDGKSTTDWSKWNKYIGASDSDCEKCIFAGHCGIIKNAQRYSVVK